MRLWFRFGRCTLFPVEKDWSEAGRFGDLLHSKGIPITTLEDALWELSRESWTAYAYKNYWNKVDVYARPIVSSSPYYAKYTIEQIGPDDWWVSPARFEGMVYWIRD